MKKEKKNKIENPDKLNAEKVISLLSKGRPKAYNFKQLARKLGLDNNKSKNILAETLNKLEKEGKINLLNNGYFKYNKETVELTGRVDHVNARFAYIVSEGSDQDIWVNSKDLNFAVDGDVVKVAVIKEANEGKRAEGKVVEVIERGKKEFVGKVEQSARYAFVVPDNKKMYYDIFVPIEELKGAKHDYKVIVEILQWPAKDKNPVGRIIEVLGPSGDNEVEMHSIMAEFGLPVKFPENVHKAAEAIPSGISPAEIKNRKDFRAITTFTIDPIDAKDFDDALSIREIKDGLWEIGIHIADVTHYVKPAGTLDIEAEKRATSVYLVDRVIPMLPEKISNELCSLRPNEDKLTFSAVFEINNQGEILNQWFGKSIIYSDRRFNYDEAQEIIESGVGDFAHELKILNNLASIFRKERFKKGAIGFETIEVKFKLDEKGKPLGVIPKIRKDAHKLIEEFMLLANKKVAEYVFGLKKGKIKDTFVYRTHDYPDPDKLNAFTVFAKKFGHEIHPEEENIAKALNKLVEDIEGKPEQNVLQGLAIRTMAKAKYTTEADIHFGLAFKHYTHFTSPIRRFPDMMVHRLLQHYLEKGKSEDQEVYEKKCQHSSDMEKRAADAERASIKYKQAEFMQDAADKVFDGIVSGVTEWGIFVEIIETKCEGLVRMVDLTDDYYEVDAQNYRVIGKSNKKIITLGDDVKVQVKQVNLDKRTIDLIFADNETSVRKYHGKDKQRNRKL